MSRFSYWSGEAALFLSKVSFPIGSHIEVDHYVAIWLQDLKSKSRVMGLTFKVVITNHEP